MKRITKASTRKLIRNFRRWNRACSASRVEIAAAYRAERKQHGFRFVAETMLTLTAEDLRV